MHPVIKRTWECIRWTLAPEELPEPVERGRDSRAEGRGECSERISVVPLSSEDARTQPAEGSRPFVAWLLSAESCPIKESPGHRGRQAGLLRWLLSAEQCPRKAPTPSPRREGVWGWLFSSDEI